jgi:hypothetical protein
VFSKLDNAVRGPRYASVASESPVETWHPQALISLTPRFSYSQAIDNRAKGLSHVNILIAFRYLSLTYFVIYDTRIDGRFPHIRLTIEALLACLFLLREGAMKQVILEGGITRLNVSVVFLGVLLICLTSNNAIRSSSQQNSIPIINKVRHLDVLDLRSDRPSHFQLELKNEYDKDITAIVIDLGSYRITSDFFPDGKIAPGETRTESFTLPASQHQITILSVVFSDDTAEGDETAAVQIKQYRLGMQMQARQIVPHLRRVLSADEYSLQRAMNSAIDAIKQLPTSLEKGSSFHLRAGLQNTKEKALEEMGELELLRSQAGNDAFRKELTKRAERFGKVISSQ